MAVTCAFNKIFKGRFVVYLKTCNAGTGVASLSLDALVEIEMIARK